MVVADPEGLTVVQRLQGLMIKHTSGLYILRNDRLRPSRKELASHQVGGHNTGEADPDRLGRARQSSSCSRGGT